MSSKFQHSICRCTQTHLDSLSTCTLPAQNPRKDCSLWNTYATDSTRGKHALWTVWVSYMTKQEIPKHERMKMKDDIKKEITNRETLSHTITIPHYTSSLWASSRISGLGPGVMAYVWLRLCPHNANHQLLRNHEKPRLWRMSYICQTPMPCQVISMHRG